MVMSLVVYNHANPFTDNLQLESRVFTFFNHTITLKQKWSSNGKGGTDIGFGASVYNAAIVLAFYLERNEFEIKQTVIELGCGPGLVAMVASLHRNSQIVVTTDGDPITVDLVNANIRANKLNDILHSQKLYWGDQSDIYAALSQLNTHNKSFADITKKDFKKFDLIVASDVAALPYNSFYGQLVDTMYQLCRVGGTVLLSYQRRHSSEDDFFKLFRVKFDYIQLPRETTIHEDFRHLPIFIFKASPRSQPLRSHSFSAISENVSELSINTNNLETFDSTLKSSLFYKLKDQIYYCKIPLVNDINNGISTVHDTNAMSSSKTLTTSSCDGFNPRDIPNKYKCTIHEGKITSDWFPIITINSTTTTTIATEYKNNVFQYSIQLRPVCQSDLCDFNHVRVELDSLLLHQTLNDLVNSIASVESTNSSTATDVITLSSTQTIIKNYAHDRKSMIAIRWGITLINPNVESEKVLTLSQINDISEKYIKNEFGIGIVIGTVGLRFDKKNYKAEIEYALHPTFWNRGIMKFAVSGMISYFIDVMKLPLRTIEAHVNNDNLRSCALLKSLGFTLQGILKQNYYCKVEKVFKDTCIYQLIFIPS